MKPNVVRRSLVNIQVCVPNEYTKDQIEEFINTEEPTGIQSSWRLDESVARVTCASCNGNVHVILEC